MDDKLRTYRRLRMTDLCTALRISRPRVTSLLKSAQWQAASPEPAKYTLRSVGWDTFNQEEMIPIIAFARLVRGGATQPYAAHLACGVRRALQHERPITTMKMHLPKDDPSAGFEAITLIINIPLLRLSAKEILTKVYGPQPPETVTDGPPPPD